MTSCYLYFFKDFVVVFLSMLSSSKSALIKDIQIMTTPALLSFGYSLFEATLPKLSFHFKDDKIWLLFLAC